MEFCQSKKVGTLILLLTDSKHVHVLHFLDFLYKLQSKDW